MTVFMLENYIINKTSDNDLLSIIRPTLILGKSEVTC